MRMTGLNFEAIPPISAPLRFYLTAPVFALIASILFALNPDTIWLSRWMPVTLALTHLVALGVMAMVMIGSLFQVMPVLCGAPIPISGWRLTLFHLTFSLGALSLSFAFLNWGSYHLPLILLGSSLGYFVLKLGWVLATQAKGEQTRLPIMLAVSALSLLLVIGMVLLGGYLWGYTPVAGKVLTNLHAGIGTFGWIMLLIMAVSFQVIPMFHVTPNFNKIWRNSLVGLLGVGVALASFETVTAITTGGWLLCIASTLLYCGLTLERLSKRKRKLPDVVVNYWRVGLANLALACLLLLSFLLPVEWPANLLIWKPKVEILLGLLFGFGFVLAIIQGMLLKIVPFLITLHLQRMMMKNPMAMIPLPDHYQLISRRQMNRQFWLYIGLLISLFASFVFPIASALVALMLACNWLCIGYNLLNALKQYRIFHDKLV